MLLVRGVVRMMLLVVQEHSRTCDLTVSHLRRKADALERHLVDRRDLLTLELVALDCRGTVGGCRSIVVWVKLQTCLDVSVRRVGIALGKQ